MGSSRSRRGGTTRERRGSGASRRRGRVYAARRGQHDLVQRGEGGGGEGGRVGREQGSAVDVHAWDATGQRARTRATTHSLAAVEQTAAAVETHSAQLLETLWRPSPTRPISPANPPHQATISNSRVEQLGTRGAETQANGRGPHSPSDPFARPPAARTRQPSTPRENVATRTQPRLQEPISSTGPCGEKRCSYNGGHREAGMRVLVQVQCTGALGSEIESARGNRCWCDNERRRRGVRAERRKDEKGGDWIGNVCRARRSPPAVRLAALALLCNVDASQRLILWQPDRLASRGRPV